MDPQETNIRYLTESLHKISITLLDLLGVPQLEGKSISENRDSLGNAIALLDSLGIPHQLEEKNTSARESLGSELLDDVTGLSLELNIIHVRLAKALGVIRDLNQILGREDYPDEPKPKYQLR